MAIISNPLLFFVTSPRSPEKMRPEMKLLVDRYGNKCWMGNRALQSEFAADLAALSDFAGTVSVGDPTFSARDRITRGPKSLGLVNLRKIGFTRPGMNFYDADIASEAFLRQLMKFQVPSPFHTIAKHVEKTFWIHPYLEILRLVYTLGRLSFDELSLFGMQLTDWHDFDKIVKAIQQFRIEKEKNKGRYRKFISDEKERIVKEVFACEIAAGRLKTRESKTSDIKGFILVKSRTMRDYADACLRYIHATGLVTVSRPSRTLTVIESRRDEVEHILNTVERDPVFVTDETAYCEHLYNADTPTLLTDNHKTLEKKAVRSAAVDSEAEASSLDANELKRRIKHAQEAQREAIIDAQITDIKSFAKYDEVLELFKDIKGRRAYDPPVSLEWNAWRTMTMMDGGSIRANLTFDDAGNPLSTAPGNNADIVCDYGDFIVIVEVTLMSGSKQYDAEGEPVARHLGDIKAKTGKSAYCLFVAPTINPSSISHFYGLHRISIKHYGGKSVVIPLTLDRFVGMLTQSKNCGYIPSPDKVRAFCEYSMSAANAAEDEEAWYAAISHKADNWLV